MGKISKQISEWLGWVEHIYTIGSILVSLGLARGLTAMIARLTSIAPDLLTTIWLISTGLFMWLFVFLGNRWSAKPSESKQPMQTQDNAVVDANQFQDVDDFYKTYDNALLLECEQKFRGLSDKYQPGITREKFLLRTLSTATILYFFESTWQIIFGSQLKAMEALNTAIHQRIHIELMYQTAVAKDPGFYSTYSFESWFGYMKSQFLIHENGYNVQISIRGREFLKYMVHCGRSSADRPF